MENKRTIEERKDGKGRNPVSSNQKTVPVERKKEDWGRNPVKKIVTEEKKSVLADASNKSEDYRPEDELQISLNAGAEVVTTTYALFRKYYPKNNMSELGMTDTIMAHGWHDASVRGQNTTWWKSPDEKTTGYDFGVEVRFPNRGGDQQDIKKTIFFQAKVVKTDNQSKSWVTFIEGKPEEKYQFELLNTYVKDLKEHNTPSAGYYICYAATGVTYVSVEKLIEYREAHKDRIGDQPDAVVNKELYANLAKPTMIAAASVDLSLKKKM